MSDFIANPADLPVLVTLLVKWIARPQQSIIAGDSESLPPLPPELDVETGLRHLRGKRALFLKALRMFRDSCGQQFQFEFRSAVRAGDWQTSVRLVQNLKGTAATIGANHVSAAAARLEVAIRASDYAEANALLAEVSEKLRILVEGLAHIG
jgi:HPt (histidine-containing phosphotransfer) domain-containing protein